MVLPLWLGVPFHARYLTLQHLTSWVRPPIFVTPVHLSVGSRSGVWRAGWGGAPAVAASWTPHLFAAPTAVLRTRG
jgi:hypothetical protein